MKYTLFIVLLTFLKLIVASESITEASESITEAFESITEAAAKNFTQASEHFTEYSFNFLDESEKNLTNDSYDINCFRDSKIYPCRFGSRTPYKYVANYIANLEFKGCTAKKIWLYVKDGIRYPFIEFQDLVIQMLNQIRKAVLERRPSNKSNNTNSNNVNHKKPYISHLEPEQYELFEKWNPYEIDELAVKWENSGEEELFQLAKRLQSRLPQLLPQNYSPNIYKFQVANSNNAQSSAKSFAMGLFGENGIERIMYSKSNSDSYNDLIVNFPYRCAKWIEEQANYYETSIREVKDFLTTNIIKTLLGNIWYRTGLKVSFDEVSVMKDMCAYEFSLDDENRLSPWCEILELVDIETVEFVKDLESYWKYGYGYPNASRPACIAVEDMFEFLNSNSEETFSAHFVDSEAMIRLVTYLGIHKDEDKFVSDGWSRDKDRQWRQTQLDPYASNLAFIRYDCNGTVPYILTMLQENIKNLQGCPDDEPLCLFKHFKDIYPVDSHHCDIEEMCRI